MASGHVFATVGTTKFDPFILTISSDEILRVLKLRGYHSLTLQIGAGDVIPECGLREGILLDHFRFKDSLVPDIQKADLIVSHAGAGTCLEVLGSGKPLVVVINEGLMDNHQTELAEQLSQDGHLYHTTCSRLGETLRDMDLDRLNPFPKGEPLRFAEFLDNVMGFGRAS